MEQPLEIAIIGAGVAGLTAARQLQQAGRTVALIEKSRGLGGRLATRRLPQASAGPTHGDHGVCYLRPKVPGGDDRFRTEVSTALAAEQLRVWTHNLHRLDTNGQPQSAEKNAPCYAAATGINALAKRLGEGLTIHRQRRAVGLEHSSRHWQITTESTAHADGSGPDASAPDASGTGHPRVFQAQQLVLALPTPQAIALLETLPDFDRFDPDCLTQLRSVRWSRCITAIATYPPALQSQAAQLPWQGIHCQGHPQLGWIGLDSSKQLNPQQPVMVIQSNEPFAQEQFEAAAHPGDSRQAVGQRLLAEAAALTEPWLAQPEALQVHRWGYAFALTPLEQRYLRAKTKNPLWFAGDWCGGDRVENAYLSGLAIADKILNLRG